MKINFEKIEQLVIDGYITKRKHPTEKLYIYNYSNKAQFEWLWNDETMLCRGLIVDENYNIISRPFRKFFNIEQLEYKMPDCSYDVYCKLDGSLGISYKTGDSYAIATRGSFESLQALKATKMLNKYNYKFEDGKTYLFEIIYPLNRIVVDYKDREELILLAIIDNETGEDHELQDIGFETVGIFKAQPLETLMKIQRKNEEGFVLKFVNGDRIKIKMDEYKRLHKLLTGVSEKRVWENLKEGSVNELLENVPDEFHKWCKGVIGKITLEYRNIERLCQKDYRDLGNRKQTAMYYKTCKYSAILFRMLDGKDYSGIIWKLVKPTGEEVFKRIV